MGRADSCSNGRMTDNAKARTDRVRAFAVVAIGGLLLALSSLVLLYLLVGRDAEAWLRAGPREAVLLVCVTTALLQMAVFALRISSSPAGLAQQVPALSLILPPLLSLGFIPLTYEHELFGDVDLTVRNVLPTVGVVWACGLLVGQLQRSLLAALSVRARPLEDGQDGQVAPAAQSTPTLAGSLGGAIGVCATAAVMLGLTGALSHSRAPLGIISDPRTIFFVGGLLVIVAVAIWSGRSVGAAPGREISRIARRLDALGYNTRGSMAWPIRITNFDEIGLLFRELESLRTRLASEIQLYQDALDRTRDADAAKASFLAAVSHELRTPLNSIIGFAQLSLEGIPAPLSEPQAEDVKLILAGGRQLLGLLNDILDISMIESGDLRLTFQDADVGEVISEVMDIHRPLVPQGVELRVEVADSLPAVAFDRKRVGQVLTNLVSNAIKFTEEGSITVRVTHDSRQAQIMCRVIDTGVGIAPDELSAIFQEYKQVGELKKRKKGTGLGLAIARSIATAHGGELTASSMPGEGSTFILALPVKPEKRISNIDITEQAARAAAKARQTIDPWQEGPL